MRTCIFGAVFLAFFAACLVYTADAADKISKDLIKLNNVRRRRGLKGARDKSFSVWSRWGDWSECSRSCDGGAKFRTRHCMTRIPANYMAGMPMCDGESRQYRSCNTKPCPTGTQDFREMQCAIYNEKPLVEWVPLEGSKNECDLVCQTSDGQYVFNFDHALDGTRCRKGSPDMCIDGKCQTVGCDGALNSTSSFDSCGVCGGRNQTCGHVHKTYSEEYPSTGFYTYNRIIMIPAGANNIRIKDKSSLNYIALKDESGEFILNGDWIIDWPGDYEGVGTTIVYQRHRNGSEDVKIDGPTDKILEVMIIFREKNPGVEYEYWMPPQKHGRNTGKDQLLSDDILVDGQGRPSEQTDSETKPESVTSANSSMSQGEMDEGEEEEGQASETKKKPKKERGKKKDKNRKDRNKARCPKCRKVRGSRTSHFCENDFVLHVEITSKTIENGQTRFDATILQTYKNTVPLGRREYIWVPNVCKCPSLKTGSQYVITGNRRYDSETGETQLVVDRDNLVSAWKDGYHKKWDKIQARETLLCPAQAAETEEDEELPTGL
ncbi:ADAMTS-like protein 5 isoform X2 [Asterias rubens]|uniref:ADAMTS-like protein 5 isoform X2 n=1 Tax=Asterias rubens TaxID=7604 RepID=UPI001455B224|nr:ADAMTS-like protein 5 isoform X2 [Asterias rubens]